jgi:hypothetical protein
MIPVERIHSGTSPVPNNCLGCLCGGGSHGNPNYSFYNEMDTIYGGSIHLKTRGGGLQTCLISTGGGTIIFEARGNTAWLKLRSGDDKRVKKPTGEPWGIPPSVNLPSDPALVNIPLATPFNPNQFPSSGNLMPTPTGSGEFEPAVPDIDNSPDPDFGLDLDLGVDTEVDPTQDPDKPTDPETPPDTPPEDDDD